MAVTPLDPKLIIRLLLHIDHRSRHFNWITTERLHNRFQIGDESLHQHIVFLKQTGLIVQVVGRGWRIATSEELGRRREKGGESPPPSNGNTPPPPDDGSNRNSGEGDGEGDGIEEVLRHPVLFSLDETDFGHLLDSMFGEAEAP